MSNKTYTFTDNQLSRLLSGCIEMFVEFRDIHGHNEGQSKSLAVQEMFDGLDADKELNEFHGRTSTLQITTE